MSLHIHNSSKNEENEFDSHKKLVVDIKSAVADHKKTQYILDAFFIGIFLIFIAYTMTF